MRKGKRIVSLLLVFCMILSGVLAAGLTSVSAASKISIYLDGQKLATDADPYIVNSRTLVPVATIVRSLGGTADWYGPTKKVTLKYNGTTIVLNIGSKTATVNGVKKTLDAAPEIVVVDQYGGGRTMVPIRFVAESFGFTVGWNDATRAVLITTPNSTGSVKLTGISIKTGQATGGVIYTQIQVTADKSLQALGLKGVTLSSPDRYYIDIPRCTLASGCPASVQQSLAASPVSTVRTGAQSNGAMRLVVDLKSASAATVSYSGDGKTMTISFKESGSSSGGDTGEDLSRYLPANYNPWSDGKLVVVIDPGHGKTTSGKRAPDSSMYEWEFNRVVAYKLKAQLEAQGVKCVMTVAKDDMTDPALATRTSIANAVKEADLFVSIHGNAYGEDFNSANGWEIYVYKTGGVAEVAAKYIEKATVQLIPEFRDRGIKTANFYVIKNTNMPAVLIEHGFYTNADELKLMKTDSFRERLAKADCTGIMNFFNSYKK